MREIPDCAEFRAGVGRVVMGLCEQDSRAAIWRKDCRAVFLFQPTAVATGRGKGAPGVAGLRVQRPYKIPTRTGNHPREVKEG